MAKQTPTKHKQLLNDYIKRIQTLLKIWSPDENVAMMCLELVTRTEQQAEHE